MNDRKAVVLLSGGIDSSTCLYIARALGYKGLALIFDYGQRHKREIESARAIAESAGFPSKILSVELPKSSALTDESSNLSKGRSIEEIASGISQSYVPARNIIFLSTAAAWAEANNFTHVFIGVHSEDAAGYPDTTLKFISAFQDMIDKGTKKKPRIEAPLLNMSKKDIIKKAIELGVPLDMTWSCYDRGSSPCMECDSCILRNKGFVELGLEDPAVK